MPELQYDSHWSLLKKQGNFSLPCRANYMWVNDPKTLLFTLSRHKFISKLLNGYQKVLEIGCGDGFANRLIQPCVGHLTSIDYDPKFIDEALKHTCSSWNVSYQVHNILESPFFIETGLFDAAFSLDVFEHIAPDCADIYANNIVKSISINGVFICGCPSMESQLYASEGSKAGHVNCMKGEDLRNFFLGYFKNVFLLSMNDEVLHTGYSPMCHYNFAVCSSPYVNN